MGHPARNIYEEARNAIGIIELLERYGFPIRRVGSSWRSSRCPACGQSPDPRSVRLAIFPDRNLWYCHRCEAKGDVIAAVAEIEGISRYEAAREILTDTCGFHRVRLRPVDQIQKEYKEATLAKSRVVSRIIRIALTSKGARKHCWDYLRGERKIPEEVIREAIKRKLLLFLPNFFQVKKEIEDKIPQDLVEKAGFVKERTDRETGEVVVRNVLPFLVGRRPIVCPFNLYFEEHLLQGAEFRAVNGAEPKTVTLGPKGFWYWASESKHLLITEGMIDALSALSLGWEGAVLGLPGVQDLKRVPESFWEGREVWLALDGDEAGQKMTEWAVSQGFASHVFEIPEDKDLNDLLREGLKSLRDLPLKTVR